MADWKRIASDNYDDAVKLVEGKRYRSAVSRLYYAAFSLLTHELIQRGADSEFTAGRATPAHSALPQLIEDWFGHFSEERRQNLTRHVSGLYADRLKADYSVLRVDRLAARKSLRAAHNVFEYFGGT